VSRRGPTLPLAAWVAVAATSTVVAAIGSAALVLFQGGLSSMETLALGAGLGVGLLFSAAAVGWAGRVTSGLRGLHADAVRRLRDPSIRVDDSSRRDLVRGSAELADLARVLDALQLRARVADEVADQAWRSAEQASAGVFELLSGLVAAEEATRGQLSAELHDTVAQTLAAARSVLAEDELRRAVAAADPRAAVSFGKASELVEDAEEQVRAVMARARPAELRDGDLASAVVALRREFAARYLFTVRLSWPDQAHPLPLVSAVTVYRFFQEGLLNVVKHTDVEEADAALEIDGDRLVAVVRDKGPGFVPGEVQVVAGRHVGLRLLRERVRLAGGSLEVDSAPGAGTTLTLRLPVSPRDSAPPSR
jgi:signal transduction histidine kinase